MTYHNDRITVSDYYINEVKDTLSQKCIETSKRTKINFIEIGNDADHVHFL
jgi:hypothetical protein